MNEEESSRLEAVARHFALNAAGVIRMLVKREFDSLALHADPVAPKQMKKSVKK